jgi:hypothetical protein
MRLVIASGLTNEWPETAADGYTAAFSANLVTRVGPIDLAHFTNSRRGVGPGAELNKQFLIRAKHSDGMLPIRVGHPDGGTPGGTISLASVIHGSASAVLHRTAGQRENGLLNVRRKCRPCGCQPVQIGLKFAPFDSECTAFCTASLRMCRFSRDFGGRSNPALSALRVRLAPNNPAGIGISPCGVFRFFDAQRTLLASPRDARLRPPDIAARSTAGLSC